MKKPWFSMTKKNTVMLLITIAALFGFVTAIVTGPGAPRLFKKKLPEYKAHLVPESVVYEEPHRMTYEELLNGTPMVSAYLGVLNVRKEPSSDSAVIDRIGYEQKVNTFGSNIDGYMHIRYEQKHTGNVMEGYCLAEELTTANEHPEYIYLACPDFKQYDQTWANLPLGDSYETIWSAGCTTCCLAMSYSYLEGHTTTPDDMRERLFYNTNGTLGMPKVYAGYDRSDFLSVIYEQLEKDIPVLVGSRRKNGSPHWVLCVGYVGEKGGSKSRGDYLIHDPNSAERTTLAQFFDEFTEFNRIAYFDPSL